MNCEQARERLIDLAYEELAPAEAQELMRHAEACRACGEELRQLRLGRAAMARYRADEPATTPVRLPAATAAAWRGTIRRLLAPAGIAAAAVAAVLWLVQNYSTRPAVAETGPVEIRRVGVSLTILSEPDGGGRAYMYGPWRGLALVRDQRLIRRLGRGASEVSFTGVPAAILPDSVRLRSLDSPDALTILEQNYQYDLVSSDAVLRKHIDQPIAATFKSGEVASGRLLSFDGANLVLQPAGQGPRTIARRQVRAVSLPKLPEGLLTAPTLLWRLQNDAAAQQQFEVAYLTGGLTWRADYVIKLNGKLEIRNSKSEMKDKEGAPLPEIVDLADLVGYATVTNNSGVTYEDAKLKLLAGDVNLIRDVLRYAGDWDGDGVDKLRKSLAEPFQEKSFFEYHLYTLGRATTIRDAETKQIEMVSGSGVKLRRAYVYDPQDNATAARVVSEVKNSEVSGLGRPLPKGVVRLYAPGPDGQEAFASQTTIDHTPKDETLRLPWGYAFDIACSQRETEATHRGPEHHAAVQYDLRNHKGYDVTVTVIARVPPTTYKARCDLPWHIREVGVVEIAVPLKAGGRQTVAFEYDYNTQTGGGLKGPDVRPETPLP